MPIPNAIWYRKKNATDAVPKTGFVVAKRSRMVMTRKERNCPDPERSMRPRRPKRSTTVTARQENMKYDVALQAVSRRAMEFERPTEDIRTVGR